MVPVSRATGRNSPLRPSSKKACDWPEARDKMAVKLINMGKEANAAGKWYTQVRRRTGKTGKLQTELRRGTGDKLEAVVSSATETDKRTYLVHRPGPLSMRKKKVLASEYAEIMSYFRKNGRLPEGIVARRIDDTGQPVQLSREVRNPLASDGKNLWNELGRKEGRKIILARADDLDAAMQRAADRLRQG